MINFLAHRICILPPMLAVAASILSQVVFAEELAELPQYSISNGVPTECEPSSFRWPVYENQYRSSTAGWIQTVAYNYEYLAEADDDTPTQTDEIKHLVAGMQEMESGMLQLESGLNEVGRNLKVTTVDKKWGLAVFGTLSGEMLFAEARPVLPSGIVLLTPDFGKDTKTFEAHGKSTSLGVGLKGPNIYGLQAGGVFLTYLYGEQYLADLYGFYIVRAYGELKNQNVRFAIGLEGDVVTPLSPTTLNYNAGNGAGNMGFFRGQFRMERYIHFNRAAQLTTQFALSDPVTTSFTDLSVPPNNLLESNGWPNIEGRMALGLGCKQNLCGGRQLRAIEFGVSGLVGELRRTDVPANPSRVLDVWAYGLDAEVALTERFGVRGEFFHGQAIGNYNAAIIQVFNGNIDEIESLGGWGEIYYYWTSCLHSHFGYSIDDPVDSTLTPGLPTQNQNVFGNLIWDVTKNLEIGFEVSHWDTDYTPAPALGPFNPGDQNAMVYHTRVRLKF